MAVSLARASIRVSNRVGLPEHFLAAIGGWDGDSFEVRLDGGRLLYEWGEGATRYGTPEVVDPGPEAWEEFRKALDALGIGRWDARYESPGILDGTSWGVEMDWGDLHVRSSGSNNYPGGDSACEQGGVFRRWCELVSRLIGGKRFE